MSDLAIIVGGSKKLGLAIAARFAESGHRLLLVARDEGALNDAKDQLPSQGAASVDVVAGDILSAQTRQAVFAKAAELGGASILVNAAGYFVWKALADLSEDAWDTTVDVQLKAPFLMTQAFAAHVKEHSIGGASVVNIGSVHGTVGDRNVVAQCAAKAGLIGLTQSCAEALRAQNIRVNAVLPGGIQSDSASAISQNLDGMITQKDVAESVYFLASKSAAGITGAAMEAYGVTRPVIASPG